MRFYSTIKLSAILWILSSLTCLQEPQDPFLNAPDDLRYLDQRMAFYTGSLVEVSKPTLSGYADSFKTVPALPESLSIDNITGTISGKPVRAFADSTFSVIAINKATGASTQATITIVIVDSLKIATQPTSAAASTGGSFQFICAPIGGLRPFSYSWFHDNLLVAGADSMRFVRNNVAETDTGTYHCVVQDSLGMSVQSQTVRCEVTQATAPVIIAAPESRAVQIGSPTTFAVTASGTDLVYHWYKNNTRIANASSYYKIDAVKLSDAGLYYISILNSLDTIETDTFRLTIDSMKIATQPANVTASHGGTFEFVISVDGGQKPLFYQWYHNGQSVAGADTARYKKINVQYADTGTYYCIVRDAHGSTLQSSSALCSIAAAAAPAIVSAPESKSVVVGAAVTFSVVASGTDLAYRWYKNNTLITNATSFFYKIDSVKVFDAGLYRVEVSNILDTIALDTVRLTVTKGLCDISVALLGPGTLRHDSLTTTGNTPIRAGSGEQVICETSENSTLRLQLGSISHNVNNGQLVFRKVSSTYTGDSLGSSGIYSMHTSLNSAGTYYAKIEVSDDAFSSQIELKIVVANVNQPPAFLDTLPKTFYQISEAERLLIRFKATDPDGDQKKYFIKQTTLPHPADALLTDSTVTWQSKLNDRGAFTLIIGVTDGSDTGSAKIDIAVGNVNLPPRITIEGISQNQSLSVFEGDTLKLSVKVSDPNNSDHPVLLQIVNSPYTIAANGQGHYDTTTGIFWYVPGMDVSTRSLEKTFSNVRFFAKDQASAFDSFSISVVVKNLNRAPTARDTLISVNEDDSIRLRLPVADADNDSLILMITQNVSATNGSISVPSLKTAQNAMYVTYKPTANKNGTDIFKYQVSDGLLSSREAGVSINVLPVNDRPTLSLVSPIAKTTKMDTVTQVLQWSSTDIDGDQLRHTVYLSEDSATVTTSSIKVDSVAAQSVSLSSFHGLKAATRYFWTVIVSDGKLTNSSAIWSFYTKNTTPQWSEKNLVLTSIAQSKVSFSPMSWLKSYNTTTGHSLTLSKIASAGSGFVLDTTEVTWTLPGYATINGEVSIIATDNWPIEPVSDTLKFFIKLDTLANAYGPSALILAGNGSGVTSSDNAPISFLKAYGYTTYNDPGHFNSYINPPTDGAIPVNSLTMKFLAILLCLD